MNFTGDFYGGFHGLCIGPSIALFSILSRFGGRLESLMRIARLWIVALTLMSGGIALASMRAERTSSYVTTYAASLHRLIGLRTDRLEDIADKTFLARQSLLEQWGVFQSAASYRDLINTISLPPELIVSEGPFRLRIKSIEQRSAEKGYLNAYEAGMIFHELSHAEFEHMIETGKTAADAKLHLVFEKEIRPWIERNFPQVSKRVARVASWELFGYYRHEAILQLIEQRDEILRRNGLLSVKGEWRCVVPRGLAARIKKDGPPEDLRETGADLMGPIAARISVPFVYARGSELEFNRAVHSPFKEEWNSLLWNHFAETYEAPETGEQIARWLWTQSPIREALQACWASL